MLFQSNGSSGIECPRILHLSHLQITELKTSEARAVIAVDKRKRFRSLNVISSLCPRRECVLHPGKVLGLMWRFKLKYSEAIYRYVENVMTEVIYIKKFNLKIHDFVTMYHTFFHNNILQLIYNMCPKYHKNCTQFS